MRALLVAVGLCVLSCGAAAQDAKYESKAGRYSVTFPGKPTVESLKAGNLELNLAKVERGSGGLMVVYTDLPAEVSKETPKSVLDDSEKELLGGFKTKATRSKDIEFGPRKLPAREVTAVQGETHIQITLVLSDTRLYQLLVVGPKELVEGKDAATFFKSFDVTK